MHITYIYYNGCILYLYFPGYDQILFCNYSEHFPLPGRAGVIDPDLCHFIGLGRGCGTATLITVIT